MDAENEKVLRAIAMARHAERRERRAMLAQEHNAITDEIAGIEKVLKATEPDEPETEQDGQPASEDSHDDSPASDG